VTQRTSTPGQALAAEIRKMYGIGTRTRWGAERTCRILQREEIIGDIREAVGEFRGGESESRTAILDAARPALRAWGKFIEGYRIDAYARFAITSRSPWQFAAFLGEMVDSGCANMGEFEQWFATKTREVYAQQIAA
jgi:hypothetical protein